MMMRRRRKRGRKAVEEETVVVSISWTCSLFIGIELRCNRRGRHRKRNRLEGKSRPGDRTARIAGNRISERVMGIMARVSHGRQAKNPPSFCLALSTATNIT